MTKKLLSEFPDVYKRQMVSTNFYGYYYVQSKGSLMRNENYQKTIKRVYDALGHYDLSLIHILYMFKTSSYCIGKIDFNLDPI